MVPSCTKRRDSLTASGQADALTAAGGVAYGVTGSMDSALFWANMAGLPANMVARALVPCFLAGTPVLTPDGEKPIEQLKPGDVVLSRDEASVEGPVESKLVEELFVREGVVLDLTVCGQVIHTTPEHPFYVQARGWTAAGDLQAGDLLATRDGRWLPLEAAHNTGRVETVYNLRIADWHTYFVGSGEWGFGVWVHNAYYQRVPLSNDLAQQALEYRKSLANPLTGRNVMVIEHVTEDGTLATKVFLSRGRHTERMIEEGTQVLRIFTERQPCGNCFNFIERAFPTAEVNYLFPYMNKATRTPTYAIQSFYGKVLGLIRS